MIVDLRQPSCRWLEQVALVLTLRNFEKPLEHDEVAFQFPSGPFRALEKLSKCSLQARVNAIHFLCHQTGRTQGGEEKRVDGKEAQAET